MTIIAFFFVMRPGEYTDKSHKDAHPFRFMDVALAIGNKVLDLQNKSAVHLLASRSVTLEFSTQNNGVPGEKIRLFWSNHPRLCPVLAVVRRILHLRKHNAPPTSPLARVFSLDSRGRHRQHSIKTSDVTKALRAAVDYIGPSLGFGASEVSARSLRAGGAMALIVSKIDPDIIRLLGRWRSDCMLRYLHMQAGVLTTDLSSRMVRADYTLSHYNKVPMY